MGQAIRERVTIQPGGTIEIHRPELPTGAVAEVTIVVQQPQEEVPSLASLIGSARGLYGTRAEADAYLERERGSWES